MSSLVLLQSSSSSPLLSFWMLILLMKRCSVLTLKCNQAEYLTGYHCCSMCLPGNRVKTDCTAFRTTSCLPCLQRTYMNQPTGLKQCFPCTNCLKGSGLRIKLSCTSWSDTVCEPLEGFYCVDPSDDGCYAAKKHRSCEPGQYISNKGTSSTDTECSDCSNGTFSNGTFTSCRPHTQCDINNPMMLKQGTASTDAECGQASIWNPFLITILTVLIVVAAVWLYILLGPCAKNNGTQMSNPTSNHGGTQIWLHLPQS